MYNIARLLGIMARLRDPKNGCPWDLEQDFVSIAPHTIEEAYEVADAIEKDDMQALKDELGDLLLQVVFHAQMAKEKGLFDFYQVANAIGDKLIRRHPHLYGNAQVNSAEEQVEAWEAIKAKERASKAEDSSALAGLPVALPALMRAYKLQKRAGRIGFDWPEAAPVYAKVEEELAEVRAAISAGEKREEIGDLLFACVNLARHLQVDPESALRRANAKFERRFREVEKQLDTKKDASLEEMDELWNKVKEAERA